MHNLHFILIKADSADEAASNAEHLILDWGGENNWRSVGGIASEDGADDVENHDCGDWGLSFLADKEGLPEGGTHFRRAVVYLYTKITDPVTLPYLPLSTHPDLRSACGGLGDTLREFDPEHDDYSNLWAIGRNVRHLAMILDSRSAIQRGEDIPELFAWQFDEFGLTDLTE